VLTKPNSLLAIAKRWLSWIVRATEFAEIQRAESHGLVETSFAEIWRNAQRRRSESLRRDPNWRSVARVVLQQTAPQIRPIEKV
jgi:hypothetical protein